MRLLCVVALAAGCTVSAVEAAVEWARVTDSPENFEVSCCFVNYRSTLHVCYIIKCTSTSCVEAARLILSLSTVMLSTHARMRNSDSVR